MNNFLKAYIAAALWSSLDDENHMDDEHGIDDLTPEALQRMTDDCEKFLKDNEVAINEVVDQDIACPGQSGWIKYAGYDFWLTRNGHGCGFWDGDWPEPQATQLDEAAKEFGECDLYVEDGKVGII